MKYLVIAGLIAAAFFCCGIFRPNYTLCYSHHTVTQGQTLWEIAETYAVIQDKTMTMDEFVYIIKKTNNIKGSQYIYPGQHIIVPVYKNK